MPHDTTLIGTIVAGLGVAFLMGALAHRLRISPIAGYLLAGILVGPFTPGFVADTGLAMQLAEIGVILLMFGVGLHFHLKDLIAVRTIAVTRIAIPRAMIRLSAGRRELGEVVQAMCFFAGANSIFYGDKLLTTGNPDVAADRALFDKLGLVPA